MAEAQSAVTSAQSQNTSDSATYTQACPNGPVVPDPGLTGAQLQAAQSSFTHCQNLQLTLNQDQGAVSKAQAQLPVSEAQAQQSIDTAQATVNSAQATLNVANYQSTLQSSPGSASFPGPGASESESGRVTAGAGAERGQRRQPRCSQRGRGHRGVRSGRGDLGTGWGPHLPVAAGDSREPVVRLLTLPIAAHVAGCIDLRQSGSEPLIELVGGRQQIMAQIPEAEVASVRVGKSATVNLGFEHHGVGRGHPVGTEPNEGINGVTYDVIVDLKRTVSGLLPGMSSTVVF